MAVDKVNFTSKGPIVGELSHAINYAEKYANEQTLKKEISNLMPKSIKTISKMSKFTGEVPNIIINALGTGLVAPIFIKYNFLSKTDEDTRTYSALRQPISAVLAVLTQAGMVIPVNRVIDNMSNTGQFNDSKYNKAGFQDVNYLKKELKKEFPKASAKELDELANKKYVNNLQKLIETAYKENSIVYNLKGKEVRLSPEGVEKILNQTTDDMLKNVTSNLSRYEGDKLAKQIQRGEYLRNNGKQVKEVLTKIETEMASKKDYKEVSELFKSRIKDLKSAKGHNELISILTEISNRPDVSTIKDKITDVKHNCKTFGNCTSMQEVATKAAAKLEVKINALKAEKAVIEKMKTAIKNKATIKEIAEIAKSIPNQSFGYDLVQKHISNVGANLKGYGQIIGLVVSLAILPITCSILNFAYPKVMKALFPGLSNKKAEKPQDEFVKAVDATVMRGKAAPDKEDD